MGLAKRTENPAPTEYKLTPQSLLLELERLDQLHSSLPSLLQLTLCHLEVRQRKAEETPDFCC